MIEEAMCSPLFYRRYSVERCTRILEMPLDALLSREMSSQQHAASSEVRMTFQSETPQALSDKGMPENVYPFVIDEILYR